MPRHSLGSKSCCHAGPKAVCPGIFSVLVKVGVCHGQAKVLPVVVSSSHMSNQGPALDLSRCSPGSSSCCDPGPQAVRPAGFFARVLGQASPGPAQVQSRIATLSRSWTLGCLPCWLFHACGVGACPGQAQVQSRIAILLRSWTPGCLSWWRLRACLSRGVPWTCPGAVQDRNPDVSLGTRLPVLASSWCLSAGGAPWTCPGAVQDRNPCAILDNMLFVPVSSSCMS
jgi:hypothetical protein